MTLFLLGYAVGLKEKIKTVMRTLLAGVSIFILYITANGTANAQLIYLQDTTTPPVLSYLNKFLNLQPKWSTSPAYSAGNKAFFAGFRDQIEDLPAEDHLRSVAYTITQLEKMSTQQVKQTYNLDKNIALAILKGIEEMAKNDISAGNYEYSNETHKYNYDEKTSSSSKSWNNELYSREVKSYQGNIYYIYALEKNVSIKQADFHNKQGSFYHCMYAQCNKVAFNSVMQPTEVHISFANGTKSIKINLNEVTTQQTTFFDDDSYEEEGDDYREEQETTEEENMSEDDLLEELSDLFGDIL